MSAPVPVQSTNIKSIAYDPDAQLLEVEFTSGSKYQYARVPPELVDGMKSAGSIGGYFHTRIRTVFGATKIA